MRPRRRRERLRHRVVDRNRMAVEREDLRDAMAHEARADDSDACFTGQCAHPAV